MLPAVPERARRPRRLAGQPTCPTAPPPAPPQYILKPPGSALSAFAWHRDSDWLSTADVAERHPYLSGTRCARAWGRAAGLRAGAWPVGPPSRCVLTEHPSPAASLSHAVWCALDDMTHANGCFVVRPGSHLAAPGGSPPAAAAAEAAGGEAATQQPQALALEVPAGSAVLTSDTLLHCSGPNRSAHMRRAWMPQFSAAPLVRSSDGQPVSLALPLRLPALLM